MMGATRASQLPRAGIGVAVSRLSKVFAGRVEAVRDISIAVPAGQFVALLGPSGCGKSTLLRLIARLDRPTAGTTSFDSPTDGRRRSDIAYVFQDPHLLPWRNVLRNVALPLELHGIPRRDRLDRAADALASVGLADAAGRYPAELSGGMRMRASLARAIVTRPRLLLLDEPFAALDEITRQSLDEQLRALWQTSGMTVLFVTHSVAEAAYLAQRTIVFSRRPARVVLDVPVGLPNERPAQLRTTADFAAATRPLFEALRAEAA